MTLVQNLSALLSIYIIFVCFKQTSCFNCHQYECTQDRPYCWTDGCHEKCPGNTVPTGLAPDSDFVVNCVLTCKPPKIEFRDICVDRNGCHAIFDGKCLDRCPDGYLLSESGDKSCFSAWVNYRKLIIVGSLIFCIFVAMAIFLSTKRFDLSYCKVPPTTKLVPKRIALSKRIFFSVLINCLMLVVVGPIIFCIIIALALYFVHEEILP